MMANRTFISSGSTFEAEIGYSRAVVQGDWIFVSGTIGFDYSTMTIADGLRASPPTAVAEAPPLELHGLPKVAVRSLSDYRRAHR